MLKGARNSRRNGLKENGKNSTRCDVLNLKKKIKEWFLRCNDESVRITFVVIGGLVFLLVLKRL